MSVYVRWGVLLLTPFWFFPICQCDVTQKNFERYQLHRMYDVVQILCTNKKTEMWVECFISAIFAFSCHTTQYKIKMALQQQLGYFERQKRKFGNQYRSLFVSPAIVICMEFSDVHDFTLLGPK